MVLEWIFSNANYKSMKIHGVIFMNLRYGFNIQFKICIPVKCI